MKARILFVCLFRLTLLLGITSLTVGFLLDGPVAAATYYVAKDGSNSNVGSKSKPFETIRHGIGQLEAGDTLYIRDGTYGESIDSNEMTMPIGDSWDTPVTIAAYPGETVTLQPDRYGAAVILLNQSYIQYLIFDSLIVDATTGMGRKKGISLVKGANHVRFLNVEVKNSPYLGIEQFAGKGLSSTSTFNEFIGMKVHGSTSHGIYITSSNNLIEDCDFYDNAGYGIHIYSESGGVNDNTVRSSRIHDNGNGGGTTAGIILGSGSRNVASDNEVWGNTIGIQVSSGGAVDTRVENNTVYENTLWGIAIWDSVDTVVEGNDVHDNGERDIVDEGTGTVLSNN